MSKRSQQGRTSRLDYRISTNRLVVGERWTMAKERYSARRWLTTLALVVAIGAVFVAGDLPSAGAYPQHPNNCNDSSMTWKFRGSLWNQQKKGWARSAINRIDDPLSYNGTKLVTVTEQSGSVDVLVKARNRDLNSFGGAECNGQATIWVNSQYTDPKFYWKVTRHEMMHLAGAEHAGNEDSMNGDNIPTMATCVGVSSFRTVNEMSQDDAAYLNWLHNALDNRQLHANMGFEQGFSYWGKINGTATIVNSGGATGPGHVSFLASGTVNSSYIYQTVRLWTGDDNESYRAKINAKTSNSGPFSTGQVRTAMYRKTMTENSGSNSCSYADDVDNANNPTVTGGYVYLAGTAVSSTSTSWLPKTSGWTNPATEDGYQLQIRSYAKGTQASTGINIPVLLDNVRGEGT